MTNKKPLTKYQKNLSIVNYNYINYVKSFSRIIARIDWKRNTLIQTGWWNDNNKLHINYVAEFYKLKIITNEEL